MGQVVMASQSLRSLDKSALVLLGVGLSKFIRFVIKYKTKRPSLHALASIMAALAATASVRSQRM